jgi:DNA-directed RNA polymerase specialized sigma24 family protein
MSHWTEHDNAILREYYPKERPEGVAVRLGRSKDAVRTQARRLKVRCRSCDYKKWTDSEIDKLKQWYPEMPVIEIAKRLGCSEDAIRLMAARNSLLRDKGIKRWTETEEAILREYYHKETPAETARRLGLGKVSVMRHANKLGLRSVGRKRAEFPAGYIKKRDFVDVPLSEVGIPTSARIQAVKKIDEICLDYKHIREIIKATPKPAKIKRLEWNGETDTIGRETGMILKPGCEFVEWLGLKQAVNE